MVDHFRGLFYGTDEEISMKKYPGKNLTERVSWILSRYTKFAPMSFNTLPDISAGDKMDASTWGSMEDIHNSVQRYAGGIDDPNQGHMSHVPTAAFDPIFWLHHA